MSALLRLVRLVNLLILAGAILLAYLLAGAAGDRPSLLFGTAGAVLLVAAFYVWNDCADRRVDQVNRPGRPIPSGAISPRRAAALGALLLTGAFAAGALSGGTTAAVLAVWAVLLAAYEAGIKRTGLPGNLLVSAVASSALLLGAHLGGSLSAGIVPALFAFFLHFGREIVKDIADAPGDREGRRRSLAIVLGDRRALVFSAVPLALLVLLSPLPFVFGLYNVLYLLIILVGVDLLLAVAFARCLRRPDRSNLGFLSRVLKGQMVVGMTAMLAGRFL
ncbi:MAG: UbiA family prenyltransferase [Candidatus Eisenbacteria bacterium]|nr:UbiA family prenyltransferase [Candidatus Eisenbacteria bacterium]